jgi:hypothetical protein
MDCQGKVPREGSPQAVLMIKLIKQFDGKDGAWMWRFYCGAWVIQVFRKMCMSAPGGVLQSGITFLRNPTLGK